MSRFKIGDIVARKSYGFDVLFRVVDIAHTPDGVIVLLRGTHYRLEADAPEADLVLRSHDLIMECNGNINRYSDTKADTGAWHGGGVNKTC